MSAGWGEGWGGGSGESASATVSAVTVIRSIVDQLTAAIVATGSRLRPCGYRRPIELEPVGGHHRLFELSLTGGRNSRQLYGDGTTTFDLDLSVRVAYARLGGDAGRGDRVSVNADAGDDSVLIADCLCDPRNWNPSVTKIREVRALPGAASREVDGPQSEVYATRFRVEFLTDWPLP